jgi:hypothetical protein
MCRLAARAILDDLADDVAKCHATDAAETAAGRTFDLGACLLAAADAHRPDLIEHLEAQLADGVRPDDCLPVLCAAAGTDTTACADAAIASVVGAS